MATKLINTLGEGGPSSCVISEGSWVVHTCISVKLNFGGLLEKVVEQRIWLFPVWLTAVRIDRRQDLTSRYFQVIYVTNVCAVLVYM